MTERLGYGIGVPLFLEVVKLVGVTATVLSTTLAPVTGGLPSVVLLMRKQTMKVL